MFHMPMSSPMMATILGFFACAEAGGAAASPRTTRNIATTTAILLMLVINMLLFCLLNFLNRDGVWNLIGVGKSSGWVACAFGSRLATVKNDSLASGRGSAFVKQPSGDSDFEAGASLAGTRTGPRQHEQPAFIQLRDQ